ncbi:MAG: WD40/YVTN/BNR-like repeat-containing protein [Solirubrobacteraceae bacterium]
MIDDPLGRLRRSNPVPSEMAPPPIEEVLRRITAETSSRPRRRTWPRFTEALVPTLGVIAAIAVAVLALVLVGGRAHRASTSTPAPGTAATRGASPTTSTALPTVPSTGMLGQLATINANANAAAGGHSVISLQQCQPCHQAAVGAHVVVRDWLATSADGQTWRVRGRPWALQDPSFSGPRDGWSEGNDGVDHAYFTHDGGQTWNQAAGPGSSSLAGVVSIADGEVWRVSNGCPHGSCPATVARGPAAGNTLRGTPTTPGSGDAVTIRAGSADTAYVEQIGPRGDVHDFATHDGGRTWARITTVCRPDVSTGLEVGGSGSLWEICPTTHSEADVLGRSSDGGQHWRTYREPSGLASRLWPVSAQTAWATTRHGQVIRTADGGTSWPAVWSAGSQPPALRGQIVDFSAQSTRAAQVILALARRGPRRGIRYFNLAVYRTVDGGRSWAPSVVALPAG